MKLLAPNPIHIQLHSDWKYTRSDKTDIRRTFKKARDRLIAEQKPVSKITRLKIK